MVFSILKATLMQSLIIEETFDPSEFEEPELYESMKILKSLDNIKKNVQKKNDLFDLKKTIKREKLKERVKIKFKRPCLDLEKMLKVIIKDDLRVFLSLPNKVYFVFGNLLLINFQMQKLLNEKKSAKT